MDEAVLEAYGWAHDDAKWDKATALRLVFYEADGCLLQNVRQALVTRVWYIFYKSLFLVTFFY